MAAGTVVIRGEGGAKVVVQKRARNAGAITGLLVLPALGLYLTAIENPNLLPGNWTPLIPGLTFYLFSIFAALYLIGVLDLGNVGGTLQTFLFRFTAGSALMWGLFTAWSIATHTTSIATLATGPFKIEYILYTGFFIAPVEELLFRVAIPDYLTRYMGRGGWFLGTSPAFALYHLPAYALQYGVADTDKLLGSLLFAAILGVVLYGAYVLPLPKVKLSRNSEGFSLGGLGLSMGIHFIYDLLVFGALIGLPLSLAGLGLVPV